MFGMRRCGSRSTGRFDPNRLHRRSIRVKGYDYALSGMYFVTICAQERVCLFGEVDEEVVSLSIAGLMVESWWRAIPTRFSGTTLDAMVVMPNHVHGIVVIEATEEPAASAEGGQGRHIGLPLQREAGLAGAGRRVRADSNRELAIPRDPSLPRIVQWFKTMTTNDYLHGVKHHGLPPFRNRLWQRNYYEHIICN